MESCLLAHPWLWVLSCLVSALLGALLGFLRGHTHRLLREPGICTTIMRPPGST